MSSLFKDDREADRLETLRSLDDKIASALKKAKALKREKAALEKRVRELEELLEEKDREMERLRTEKISVKGQLEELLAELESLEL